MTRFMIIFLLDREWDGAREGSKAGAPVLVRYLL